MYGSYSEKRQMLGVKLKVVGIILMKAGFPAMSFELYFINYVFSLKVFESRPWMNTHPIL